MLRRRIGRQAAVAPAPDLHENIATAPSGRAGTHGNAGSILLVEEDDAVRSLVRATLEPHGYRVIEAADAREALLNLGQPEQHVRLLLTDLMLPGMSGRGLAMAVKVLRPEMKVIYMSARPDNAAVRRNVVESAFSYLQKPIRAVDLLSKVQEQLGVNRG